MSERDTEKIIALLEELRDGQKLQLDRQAEAIAQQRERLAALDQAKAAAQNIQDQSANTLRKSEQLITIEPVSWLYLSFRWPWRSW